jgi:hypothetical protein
MERSREEITKLLTLRANMVRSRLSATLGALDRRRREVVNLPLQVKEHLGLVAAVAGACAVGLVAFGIYRARTAARRLRQERWRMFHRVWMHPERTARPEETALGKVARVLLVGAARLVVARLLSAAEETTSPVPARLNR